MLMQPFSILQQSRPPICMQFVAFQSHRMSDRAPTEGEIKRHKICQIDRVSEKKRQIECQMSIHGFQT